MYLSHWFGSRFDIPDRPGGSLERKTDRPAVVNPCGVVRHRRTILKPSLMGKQLLRRSLPLERDIVDSEAVSIVLNRDRRLRSRRCGSDWRGLKRFNEVAVVGDGESEGRILTRYYRVGFGPVAVRSPVDHETRHTCAVVPWQMEGECNGVHRIFPSGVRFDKELCDLQRLTG